MMVFSRRKGESLVLGDGSIEVFVVEIRGDKVRLGVETPKNVPVHRAEVQAYLDQQREQRGE